MSKYITSHMSLIKYANIVDVVATYLDFFFFFSVMPLVILKE